MAESASLEAKILVLRHQRNVLSRKSAVARGFSQQDFFVIISQLSCPIRRYMDSPLRPFFQVSSVRVRAQLAFGPVLALTQVGASGAPTRRCQVPNMRTLGPLTLSKRAFFSDDQHFSDAGQMLEAAYDFSLISTVPGPIVGAGLPG